MLTRVVKEILWVFLFFNRPDFYVSYMSDFFFFFGFGFGKENYNKNLKQRLGRSEGRRGERFRGPNRQTSAFPCFSRLIEPPPPHPHPEVQPGGLLLTQNLN